MRISKHVKPNCIKDQIKALETTLEEYENETHDTEQCQLCKVAIRHFNLENSCNVDYCTFCPWTWITGVNCDTWYHRRYELGATILKQDLLVDKSIIEKRKRQIKVWIELLRNYK